MLSIDNNIFSKIYFTSFDPLWLRFNCHSLASKQPDSGQIIIDKDRIPFDLSIENVQIIDNNLSIEWNKESKQQDSLLPLNFLINNCPLNTQDNLKHQRFKTSKVFKHFYQK